MRTVSLFISLIVLSSVSPLVAQDRSPGKPAAKGVLFSVGLSMKDGSADQQFDLLRIDDATPGSAKIVIYVMYSWFGPNVLYKV